MLIGLNTIPKVWAFNRFQTYKLKTSLSLELKTELISNTFSFAYSPKVSTNYLNVLILVTAQKIISYAENNSFNNSIFEYPPTNLIKYLQLVAFAVL
jgi:hypothetical protein